jgi:hypothetical protein
LSAKNVDERTARIEGSLPQRCCKVFSHEPLYVDLTTDAARGAGYFICRVLVPHAFRKEWKHQRAFRGGRRLSANLSCREDLNLRPHPFG